MGHSQVSLRMLPRFPTPSVRLLGGLSLPLHLDIHTSSISPCRLISRFVFPNHKYPAYHRIHQFDTIVIWGIVTRSDHHTYYLAVQLPGAQGCEQASAIHYGVEDRTEMAKEVSNGDMRRTSLGWMSENVRGPTLSYETSSTPCQVRCFKRIEQDNSLQQYRTGRSGLRALGTLPTQQQWGVVKPY